MTSLRPRQSLLSQQLVRLPAASLGLPGALSTDSPNCSPSPAQPRASLRVTFSAFARPIITLLSAIRLPCLCSSATSSLVHLFFALLFYLLVSIVHLLVRILTTYVYVVYLRIHILTSTYTYGASFLHRYSSTYMHPAVSCPSSPSLAMADTS